MDEHGSLRERARQLIQAGRLPNRRPDRMWADTGSGADCAVCHAPLQPGKIEYDLQFAPDDGASQRAEAYHLHVRCFAASYEERRDLERATSRARMPDRRCHDCGTFLRDGEGWIVPLDYPGMGLLLATLDKIPICDRCFLTRHGRGPANPRHVMPLRHSWRKTAVIEERAEDTVMIEGSLEDYLDGIRQLERALLRFMMAAHREGVCGANGAHREECIALFEQLGWEGYEEYLSAMSPIADAEGTS